MRLLTLLICLLSITGCRYVSDEAHQERLDTDGDGVLMPDDCDLTDGSVGEITWYPDLDGDGYGDEVGGVVACTAPEEGMVQVAGDCDDTNADFNPDSLWYADVDGDGFGDDDADEISACEAPPDTAAQQGDCDDDDPLSYPGATYYSDADGDGFGDSDISFVVETCSVPPNYVQADGDCDDDDAANFPGAFWYLDSDGDGEGDPATEFAFATCDGVPPGYIQVSGDCNDADATINTEAVESCNGSDDDCDGLTDDADDEVDGTATFYLDSDGDGFGDPAVTADACVAPTDHVGTALDCDDKNDAINPGSEEICDNGVDNDCDSLIDDADAVTGQTTWFGDDDEDGYGEASRTVSKCVAPPKFAELVGDCDDGDALVNPGAVEVCDADDTDEDCNGAADDADAVGAREFYVDADGDAHGVSADPQTACDLPTGFALVDDDCDDADGNTYPLANEICDGLDNDCDTVVDNDTSDVFWYADTDGDGFGNPLDSQESCAQPPGFIQVADDCDDTSVLINPDGTEVCNGVDDDCDTEIDDDDSSLSAVSWFADVDTDTYGDASNSQVACSKPDGFVSNDEDCNDGNIALFPGAAEECDDLDNDCDGLVDDDDDDVSDPATWYRDFDTDTYGDLSTPGWACDQLPGFVADSTDCDDTNIAVNPDPTTFEDCDTVGVDDNCNGFAEEYDPTAVNKTTFYADADDDGYGDVNTSDMACIAPTSPTAFVEDSADCDDADASIHPGALETCDGVDEDCDGMTDEDVTSTLWYLDGDGDGHAPVGAATQTNCAQPTGYVATNDDCDDTDAAVNPSASELCSTAYDDDCDGAINESNAVGVVTWYEDNDADGYGNASSTISACPDPTPGGYVLDATDCDDTDGAINPAANEVCDLDVDNDCDGVADDLDPSTTGEPTWYADTDNDGYGDLNSTTKKCDMPSTHEANSTDCDDTKAAVNPGAPETCSTAYDDDCDGMANEDDAPDAPDWYIDTDNDGFANYSTSPTTKSCVQPSGTNEITDPEDCDDSDNQTYPGAAEICDSKDNDCDGDVDEGTVDQWWYQDKDGDGYGSSISTLFQCPQPPGFVLASGDCDEDDWSINPGADEVCDGIDNDCDYIADNDPIDGTEYNADVDGDWFGDWTSTQRFCDTGDLPWGWVMDDRDCDDTLVDVNPDAQEDCQNGIDDDCDGEADNCGGGGDVEIGDSNITFWGGGPNAHAGSVIIPLGDIDSFSDGIDEFAVGAPGASNVGIVYIVTSDFSIGGELGNYHAIVGNETGAAAGASIAYGPNDGFMVAGAPQHDLGRGAAYIFTDPLGTTSFGNNDHAYVGEGPQDRLGSASAAMDMDGDYIEDIIFSAPKFGPAGSRMGRVYIDYGTPDEARFVELRVDGNNTQDELGEVLIDSQYDLDGDFIPDLLVSAPKGSGGQGMTYVIPGASSGAEPTGQMNINSIASASYNGESGGDDAGRDIAILDADMDGNVDIVVGAPRVKVAGVGSDAGRAYIMYCPCNSTRSLSTSDVILNGSNAGDEAGFRVANLGYVDADSGGEGLGVGARRWDRPDPLVLNTGVAYLVTQNIRTGGTYDLDTQSDARIFGTAGGDDAGWDISTIGNANMGTTDDIAIGARSDNTNGNNAGAVHIFYSEDLGGP